MKILLIFALLLAPKLHAQVDTVNLTQMCKLESYSKLPGSDGCGNLTIGKVVRPTEPVFGYPDAGCVCRIYKCYGFYFKGKFVTLFRKNIYTAADKKRIRDARKKR